MKGHQVHRREKESGRHENRWKNEFNFLRISAAETERSAVLPAVSTVMSSACICNYPLQDYKPSKAPHTHIVGTLGFIYPNTHPSLSCFCVCPGTGGCDLLLQEIAGDE